MNPGQLSFESLARPGPPLRTFTAGPLDDLDFRSAQERFAAEWPPGRAKGEFAGETPRPCRCDHPIIGVDEFGDRRCWLCGHPPREAGA